MERSFQLNIPVPKPLYLQVKEHCKRHELTIAGLVRRLLKEHLKEDLTS